MFVKNPGFGRLPQGERLGKLQKSPNYKNGSFHNITPAPPIIGNKRNILWSLLEFSFRHIEGLRPKDRIPTIKTNIKGLNPSDNLAIWLGHSSIYMQLDGKKILVDPVFVIASPISIFNRAFKGSDVYKPKDIPEIDYVIITHDHWDHLDYNTIVQIKNRVKTFICPLGVGEHLEYWGIDKKHIIELDWWESAKLDNNITVNCSPARHFSGRSIKNRNSTLWASYVIQSPAGSIFLSGDTGYDSHFRDIKNKFGDIKLAFMENGQYDEQWKYIHLMPKDFIKAVKDIRPDTLITIHNSKYALARHKWEEPLNNAIIAAKENHFNLLTPMIGQIINISTNNNTFKNWWQDIK
ncbi:MAG: MBL fold metallo-hydrolase [Solitalea-like symbiont of Tyrophagus putrescentiae]